MPRYLYIATATMSNNLSAHPPVPLLQEAYVLGQHSYFTFLHT